MKIPQGREILPRPAVCGALRFVVQRTRLMPSTLMAAMAVMPMATGNTTV